MKITIVGTGYVGLVAGTCFADTGNEVICVDIDREKIDTLNRGEVPIYEPGLKDMVDRNLKEDLLCFTTDAKYAVEKSQVIFIAVGTPPAEDGSADLKHVLAVARDIGKYMNGFKVVVDKSTVPVGTTEKVAAEIKKHTNHKFAVVSNPEFLKEGAAIDDFLRPDRIVIGTTNEEAAEIMKDLYRPFVRSGAPILVMDEPSAELTKYAANSLLATKISFINEIANLCDVLNADVEMVRRGIGTDSRIGPQFIYPGTGYGGSCFPKDVKALIKTAANHGLDLKIVKAVEAVNQGQKTSLMKKINSYFKGEVKGKTFAMWGLAFKPKTDDMREAPSLTILPALQQAGAEIRAYDPVGMEEAKKLLEGIHWCQEAYATMEDADALVIITEWNAFRSLDLARVKRLMKTPVVVDLRNIYDPKEMAAAGFRYASVGRGFKPEGMSDAE